MGQRRPGDGHSSGAIINLASRLISAFTTSEFPRCATSRPLWPQCRPRWLRLLPLLVQRPTVARASRSTRSLPTHKPDFPFLLVWANENWTRAWDGGEEHVLLEQAYSLADDLAHIRALRSALCDERYICRDGRPVFAVYRSKRLPDPVATTDTWRREAERWGLPGLYLLRVESAADELGDPRILGFDAAVEFQPAWSKLGNPLRGFDALRPLRKLSPRYSHHVYVYRDVAERAMSEATPHYPRWPGVTPGFDNTARRPRNAHIFVRQSPQVYQKWLSQALRRSQGVAQRYEGGGRGVVFINAWNEWAEGNYLGPDHRFGHAFLDATKAAIEHARGDGK